MRISRSCDSFSSAATTSALTATARRISSGNTVPAGSRAACGSASIRSRITGSAMKPAFTISAMPATISLRGSVSSVARSMSTAGGLVERADQVLSRVGVDAGLAADRGVDHAQQRGGHVHDVHAAQPGGGGESGDVGGRSPAEADDRVLAANADAAQHFPDEPEDWQLFAGFGVGDLDAVCIDAPVRQVAPDRLGCLRQHRLVQDCDLVPAVQYAAQFAEQTGADDHRVWRVDENVDGHRLSHGGPLHCGPPPQPGTAEPRSSAPGSATTDHAAMTGGGGAAAVLAAAGFSRCSTM